MKQATLFPLISFNEIAHAHANECLLQWGHKMGILKRGNQGAICHAVFHNGDPVAVIMASNTITANIGGGCKWMTRQNTIELSRLCAARPGLCRVALRLWREFVFPELGFKWAVSYQDADLHTGNTYRFDGWSRVGYSASGADTRSGRQGRKKWIWCWPQNKVMEKTA